MPNQTPLSQVIRNLARMLLWGAVIGVLLLFTINAGIANYQACLASFELLGYEQRPLESDELIGVFFAAFFPDATLAHFYAMIVAGSITLGLFILSHLIFHLHFLYEQRRAYQGSGDGESASIMLQLGIRHLIYLAVLIVPIIWVIHWDLELFRFRSIAAMLGFDDPATAAMQVPSWEVVQQQYGDLAATKLSLSFGPYGYVGVTALLCIGLEIVFRKLSEEFTSLMYPVDNWATLAETASDPSEYAESSDQDGIEAVLDTQADDMQPEEVPLDTAPNDVHEVAEMAPETDLSREVEVIGDQGGGQTVAFSTALEDDSRYHVDPHTFQVWDRAYWESLHGPDEASKRGDKLPKKEAT